MLHVVFNLFSCNSADLFNYLLVNLNVSIGVTVSLLCSHFHLNYKKNIYAKDVNFFKKFHLMCF